MLYLPPAIHVSANDGSLERFARSETTRECRLETRHAAATGSRRIFVIVAESDHHRNSSRYLFEL